MINAENRIADLATIARKLTGLPVADQIAILGAVGLTLDDINWENRVSDQTGLLLRIPTMEDGKELSPKKV